MSIDSIALATGAAAIFILRKRDKNQDPPFKVPLFPLTPIIFILFLLMVTVNVIISDTVPALTGLGLFLAGWPLYYILKKLNPD